ncbi:hypothetical protein EDC04DRAFT_2971528 [Pisolithus marmoratus]|nr:hypothetical protein EDC04DRAFT_2971528 [Pisolithus marmoratus]
MLKAFLVDCMNDPDSSYKHVLFKNCLEAVLPICNGSFQVNGLKVQPSYVKYHLKAYSEKYNMNENTLYPDFMQAVNTALLCLQLLHIPKIRPHGHSPIYFHINDPSLLMQSHQGEISHHKPDIVLVLEQDTLQARGSEENISHPDDLPLNIATMHPQYPFRWHSIRTFVECKTSKCKMETPPETYTCQPDSQTPKRKYL